MLTKALQTICGVDVGWYRQRMHRNERFGLHLCPATHMGILHTLHDRRIVPADLGPNNRFLPRPLLFDLLRQANLLYNFDDATTGLGDGPTGPLTHAIRASFAEKVKKLASEVKKWGAYLHVDGKQHWNPAVTNNFSTPENIGRWLDKMRGYGADQTNAGSTLDNDVTMEIGGDGPSGSPAAVADPFTSSPILPSQSPPSAGLAFRQGIFSKAQQQTVVPPFQPKTPSTPRRSMLTQQNRDPITPTTQGNVTNNTHITGPVTPSHGVNKTRRLSRPTPMHLERGMQALSIGSPPLEGSPPLTQLDNLTQHLRELILFDRPTSSNWKQFLQLEPLSVISAMHDKVASVVDELQAERNERTAIWEEVTRSG